MNIGFYACLIMMILFLTLTVLFFLLGEKAALLISGFNSLPKEKRECYDTQRICKDQLKSLITWSIIMAVGAIISLLVSKYFSFVAFAIWLIVFFKDVHMDIEKAFEKYIKK